MLRQRHLRIWIVFPWFQVLAFQCIFAARSTCNIETLFQEQRSDKANGLNDFGLQRIVMQEQGNGQEYRSKNGKLMSHSYPRQSLLQLKLDSRTESKYENIGIHPCCLKYNAALF